MKKYDVAILGGGLAGQTLALQIKLANPTVSVTILEKRSHKAPEATHKVGESTVELGAFYLREVLQLRSYLTEHQLPKFGFRFFLSPECKDDITRRVEVGSRIAHPLPTHQIDRGILENDLLHILNTQGVDFIQGAAVKEVILSGEGHTIRFDTPHDPETIQTCWVIDATGRRSLLKRLLDLEKPSEHAPNAAWFRLDAEIDIAQWSAEKSWQDLVAPGRRRLATNHLMGTGYWVWLIPLVSGATSIGIVADPAYHPFDTFNTLEKAMQWLRTYEPLAADKLSPYKALDFKVMKHYAHDIRQFYSADRWAITGDAGAFLDPFYSPGTDFIALSNSWITELVTRDLAGNDIHLPAMIFEHAHRELLNGWLLLYQNMYGVFGNTQIMLAKIVWDWGTYWSIPTVIFKNNGYTDIAFLKQYSATTNSIGRRFAKLNERMQALFRAWNRFEQPIYSDAHINVFDLECLYQFHRGLAEQIPKEHLIKQIETNLNTLEYLAAEIFRRACAQMHGTSADLKVDPYTMSLEDTLETILEKASAKTALDPNESIQADIDQIWLPSIHHKTASYAI